LGARKEAPLPGLRRRTLQNNNLAVLLLAALLTAALLTTLAGLLLPTAATLLPTLAALLVLLITLVRHQSTPWVANNNVSVGLTVPDPIIHGKSPLPAALVC
jgi:hypothetical protein